MIDTWNLSPETIGWGIVGVVIFLLVGFALYALIGGILIGLFLYYAMRPVYQWLNERIDHPDINATITLMVVGVPMLAVLAYALYTGIQEFNQLLNLANLESLRSAIQPYVNITKLKKPSEILAQFQGGLPQVLNLLTAIFTWGLRLFVAVTVAFYLLRDDYKIAEWIRRSFHGEYGVVSFLEGVDDDLTTIYSGNMITILATGLIAVAVYYGLNMIAPSGSGIIFPVLLGLLTGVATLIPALGMKLVYWPYTGYLLWQSISGQGAPIWFPVVFFIVTFLIVDTFPDIFIRSYISKGELNMGLIMLAYVLGAYAFGWYGVFLAPVILVLFLHFAHRVFPNLLDPAHTRLVTDDWPE